MYRQMCFDGIVEKVDCAPFWPPFFLVAKRRFEIGLREDAAPRANLPYSAYLLRLWTCVYIVVL